MNESVLERIGKVGCDMGGADKAAFSAESIGQAFAALAALPAVREVMAAPWGSVVLARLALAARLSDNAPPPSDHQVKTFDALADSAVAAIGESLSLRDGVDAGQFAQTMMTTCGFMAPADAVAIVTDETASEWRQSDQWVEEYFENCRNASMALVGRLIVQVAAWKATRSGVPMPSAERLTDWAIALSPILKGATVDAVKLIESAIASEGGDPDRVDVRSLRFVADGMRAALAKAVAEANELGRAGSKFYGVAGTISFPADGAVPFSYARRFREKSIERRFEPQDDSTASLDESADSIGRLRGLVGAGFRLVGLCRRESVDADDLASAMRGVHAAVVELAASMLGARSDRDRTKCDLLNRARLSASASDATGAILSLATQSVMPVWDVGRFSEWAAGRAESLEAAIEAEFDRLFGVEQAAASAQGL